MEDKNDDVFDYFDGEKTVNLDMKAQATVLCEIMNRTNSDPDSLVAGTHDKEIVAIVRDAFKLKESVKDKKCVSLWTYFLLHIQLSEMIDDERGT